MLNFTKLHLCLLTAIAVVGTLAMAPESATGAQAEAAAPAESSAAEVTTASAEEPPALRAGRVVHVDPRTGRKIAPSPAQRAAGQAHLGSLINRSTAGLIETASPTSGVMVNLQGRFRHATVLTVSEAGDIASQCSADSGAEEADHE